SRKENTATNVKLPADEDRGCQQHPRAHEAVGRARPIDGPATDEELFVHRLEQEEIEVAGAHQVGKVVAVFQEQSFEQSPQGEIKSKEKQVLISVPVGDPVGFGENRFVKGDENPQPE